MATDLTPEELKAANDRLLQRQAELAKDGATKRETPPERAEVDDVLARVAAKAKERPANDERRECGCEVMGVGAFRTTLACDFHVAQEVERRGELARAGREKDIGRLMADAGVLREHAGAKLEDFVELVRRKAEVWLDGPEERCGLLVKGPTGTGKTRLAAAIVRPWLIDGGRVWMTPAGDLFARIRATFRDDAKETEEQLVAHLKSVGLLVIDDLGNEGTVTPFVCAVLHRVLSARNGDFRATIVTTNLKAKDIESVYGQAIASRVACWDQLVIDGDDRRKVRP